MSERLQLIEKLAEIAQKIANPPAYPQGMERSFASVELLKQLVAVSKELGTNTEQIRLLASELEAIHEEVKRAQTISLLATLIALAAVILAALL